MTTLEKLLVNLQESQRMRDYCLRAGDTVLAEYWLGKQVAYAHAIGYIEEDAPKGNIT